MDSRFGNTELRSVCFSSCDEAGHWERVPLLVSLGPHLCGSRGTWGAVHPWIPIVVHRLNSCYKARIGLAASPPAWVSLAVRVHHQPHKQPYQGMVKLSFLPETIPHKLAESALLSESYLHIPNMRQNSLSSFERRGCHSAEMTLRSLPRMTRSS
jgi:hypothetical protein